MPSLQPEIPPHIRDLIRHLPPDIKALVKSALRFLAQEPRGGTPLGGELEGFWKYRVRRFRIIYAVDMRKKALRVLAVGHRREIYDEVTRILKPAAERGRREAGRVR
ncbi:MAG: type II toxin-antitoxin system RelE/ParE family toxin [Nitrospirae bacterium]|nr:type II toxin-antitoxin system RelE/ParE family toxin [Nitrospirota bacterium]MBI3393980.1 type II toxin-antitoxin system RelE/ParE family toxin [Nitrospirota bacterium]